MDPDGTKDCTWLGFGGRYLTTSCNRKMGFICSKYAQGKTQLINNIFNKYNHLY